MKHLLLIKYFANISNGFCIYVNRVFICNPEIII